jgi:hypothetical protein
VISGTPTAAGTNNVTITASNAGGTDTEILVLTVNPAPTSPVISSALTASAVINSAFNYQITASGNPSSYGASGLPAGLTNNATTGAISGTPAEAGTFNVIISATNGAGTGSATLVLTVASAANAPVITSAGSATGTVGTAFSYQITASNTPNSYTVTGLPAGLTNNPSTGLISGTPTAAGTSLVNLSASNSGGTGSATLLLTINPGGGGGGSFSGVLAGWDFNGLTGAGVSPQAPMTTNANVTVGGLTRGSAFGTTGTPAGNAWGTTVSVTSPTNATTAVSANSFITFTVKANSGYTLSLSNIPAYNVRRSGTGPTSGQWQYSTNGTTFTDIGTAITWGSTTTSGGNSQTNISLSGISALQSLPATTTVTFRCALWGATNTAGTWYLNQFQTGDDFVVAGTVASTSSGAVPTLASEGTLTGSANPYGSASTNPPSFTLTGSNLTANVALSASPGFEISQTAGGGSGYAATQTLTPISAKVSNAVYVRLTATSPVGSYLGYVLCNTTNSAGLTVSIPTNTVTKKDISITGLSGVDKIYDGTTTSDVAGSAMYAGLVNGESFNVSGSPVAAFATPGVGSRKAVTVTGYNAPSPNYNLLPVSLNANITAKPASITGMGAVDKVYDGTATASLTGTPTPQATDLYSDDLGNVSVTGIPLAEFTSANVGTDVPITVSGYSFTGSAAGNYWPVQPSGLTASITPKAASVTAANRSKTRGDSLVLGPNQTTGFSASGLVNGEKVDRVTLTASGGTATNEPSGTYIITPSDAASSPSIPPNPFKADNYNITYVAGTLTVVDPVTQITLAEWASKYPNLTDPSPNADPDGDGMSNLMEFFLGLDPTQSGGTSGPVMTLTNGPSNTLTMTYRRAKGVTGISSGVQTIGDLSTTNWGTNGIQETVTDKGDYEEVTATVTNAPGETRRFMRLKVSQP